MPDEPKKVVYLFGAGATHAEIQYFFERSDEKFVVDRSGLRNQDIAKRIFNNDEIRSLQEELGYDFSKTTDIEQLITLLDSNNNNTKGLAKCLRKLYFQDIKLKTKDISPFLFSSLFEINDFRGESISAFLSLNYDLVFDKAYQEFVDSGTESKGFNYGAELSDQLLPRKSVPFLKLHGSLGWEFDRGKLSINRDNGVPSIVIPPGINKNYFNYPYTKIWGAAHEVLLSCDILRIIGCSLSSNDLGLLSLLSQTQINKRFRLQILNEKTTEELQKALPFLINVEGFEHGDAFFGAEGNAASNKDNLFFEWAKFEASKLDKRKLNRTKYLKQMLK